MTWQRLAFFVVGIGAGALGVLIPATAPFALPAATGIIGLAVNAERMLGKPRDPDDVPTKP